MRFLRSLDEEQVAELFENLEEMKSGDVRGVFGS